MEKADLDNENDIKETVSHYGQISPQSHSVGTPVGNIGLVVNPVGKSFNTAEFSDLPVVNQ